jgi:ubiquinone biosynthesis monooxygenase Coq7
MQRIIVLMQSRNLTSADRLLSGLGNALRSIAAPAGKSPRANPAKDIPETDLDERQKAHSAGLMRINHAGEVAAQGLYQGHAVVARDSNVEEQMQAAADEEFDHLAWCEERLTELGETPSKLSPLWYGGAFTIGALSGVLGDKWSLGFIAETERQVCDHLDSHLDQLPDDDQRSRSIVATMRDEEAEHGENAKLAGAAELPHVIKQLMRATAKLMTSTAYRI